MMHPIDLIQKDLSTYDLSKYNKSVFTKQLVLCLKRTTSKKLSNKPDQQTSNKLNSKPNISDIKFDIFSSYFAKYNMKESDWTKSEFTKKNQIDEIIQNEDYVIYYAIIKNDETLDPKYNEAMLTRLLAPKDPH